MKIKSSKSKQNFTTGASRSGGVGRGRPSLMPFDAFIEISRVMEAGAEVHDARNWEKGIPESAYLDSCMRHLDLYLAGDSTEPHLSQFAWNAVCWLATRLRVEEETLVPSLRDLPGAGHGIFPGVESEGGDNFT